MGTKRLLYIPLPPDGTHHSNWQEATLLFLKLSYFLLCWIQTHQGDWYLLLYTEHLATALFFFKSICIPEADLSPSLLRIAPPAPTTFLPYRYRNHGIHQWCGESTRCLTTGTLWLIEFSGQLKSNLCVSSYPNVCAHLSYDSGFSGPLGHLSKYQVSLGGILDPNKESIGYWIQCALVWRTCPRRWYF